MRIIVSDSSCLIDLRKVSLLESFLRLPYEVLIPNTLFESELLKFTAAQKKTLTRGGLQVIDLPGERVTRAQQVIRTSPRLSVNDAFAFSLAESHPGSILLTGDSSLRTMAEAHQIEVHGVLCVGYRRVARPQRRIPARALPRTHSLEGRSGRPASPAGLAGRAAPLRQAKMKGVTQ